MIGPKNVLLVTNATTEEEITLIKAALRTQHNMQIKLNLVHVIPSMPTCYFNIPSTVLLAERYYDEAEKMLTNIGHALSIDKKNQWLITGRIKTEVLRLANKLNAHFILASSTNIPELHKSVLFKKERNSTLIQSINNLVQL
ncbi:MAG: hypothetical protein P4M14_06920 [Gammaproteobacteria bacterium]|nr:hypothetical protein [Gammaproteobacteria bacterium]